MTVFVALLRGVNMGGNNKLAMADLREMAAGMGLTNPRTLLASGSLIFEGQARAVPPLEAALEKTIAERFAMRIGVMVRTLPEWRGIVAANPMREAERNNTLAVVFLKSRPKPKAVKTLENAIEGREYFEIRDREMYAVYPDGFGRSKLTLPLIARTLETDGTARGWNTVLRIAGAMEKPEPPAPRPIPKALRRHAAYARRKKPLTSPA